MKKVVLLGLTVLLIVFALASCENGTTEGGGGGPDKHPLIGNRYRADDLTGKTEYSWEVEFIDESNMVVRTASYGWESPATYYLTDIDNSPEVWIERGILHIVGIDGLGDAKGDCTMGYTLRNENYLWLEWTDGAGLGTGIYYRQ